MTSASEMLRQGRYITEYRGFLAFLKINLNISAVASYPPVSGLQLSFDTASSLQLAFQSSVAGA